MPSTAAGSARRADPGGPPPPARREAVVGGLRVAFRRAGPAAAAGAAAVLLHGLGGSAAIWRRQYAAFGRPAVGWDMPGYGGSEALPGAPRAEDYARHLAGLLDALGLGPVHLVGQSAAALVAAALARAAPGRLRSVVFAHPLTGFGALPQGRRAREVDARVRPFEALGAAGFARSRAPGLLAAGAPAALVAEVAASMAGTAAAPYRQAVAMMGPADLFAAAPALRLPALVVAGSEDRLAPPAACARLAAALPDGRAVTIARAGHYAALERPAAFNRALGRFFAAADGG